LYIADIAILNDFITHTLNMHNIEIRRELLPRLFVIFPTLHMHALNYMCLFFLDLSDLECFYLSLPSLYICMSFNRHFRTRKCICLKSIKKFHTDFIEILKRWNSLRLNVHIPTASVKAVCRDINFIITSIL
jgi:hypothetical protein